VYDIVLVERFTVMHLCSYSWYVIGALQMFDDDDDKTVKLICLSVISTYIHGKAQTPLVRFVVDILDKQVCQKYTRNRTDGA